MDTCHGDDDCMTLTMRIHLCLWYVCMYIRMERAWIPRPWTMDHGSERNDGEKRWKEEEGVSGEY